MGKSNRSGRITCRQCGTVFANADAWADFEDCTNTGCRCPKVEDAMTAAQHVINKAKQVPKKATFAKKEHAIPDGYREDEEDSLLYIEVPTVQTFVVHPTTSPVKK